MACLLIDGDNVRPSALPEIIEDIKERESLHVIRLYADFTNPKSKGWQDIVESYPIECIHVYATRSQAVDLTMSLDALRYVGEYSYTLCIASGDRDFTHVLRKVKTLGTKVIVYATNEHVPDTLKNHSDEFIHIQKEDAKVTRVVSKKLRRKVHNIVQSYLDTYGEDMDASHLNQTLISTNASHNYKNYGFQNFKPWIESMGLTMVGNTVQIV